MKTNFIELVNQLAEILRGDASRRLFDAQGYSYRVHQTAPARLWHRGLQRRFTLHPAVLKALESDHRPFDWHLLTLEWPHVSETDSTRLAYTRDERAGEADRQVVTTVGKYLTRHFTTMPDHEVRNLVALYAAGDSCKFVHTMAEMLHHLVGGPTSCMTKHMEIRCADRQYRHPYQVYDPAFGWHMAVRVSNGETVGRALCMEKGGDKYFVRSYRKTSDYSPADEQLEAWLESQGYTKQSRWDDGDRLAYYPTADGDVLAPYIDGNNRGVSLYGDHLRIDSNGEYECSNTEGVVSGSDRVTCEDCGRRFDEGDGYWVHVHEETHVCETCCNDDYTYAYSRRGNQYYIRNDNVVDVCGEYYDLDYLSDNNIVELADGSYEDMDNCVEIDGEWYRDDDDDICYAEDVEEYCLKDDCWQCAESDKWYTDNTEHVDVDGETYHPDNAPEQTTEE